MMTIYTVTHAPNVEELKHCVATFRMNQTEPVEWLIETGPDDLDIIREALPDERVELICPEAIEIKRGFFRQQAAKLGAARKIKEGVILFVDDDVLALRRWSPGMFLRGHESPVLWFMRTNAFPWAGGHLLMFNQPPVKCWEFAQPFAFRAETLRRMDQGDIGKRMRDAWSRSLPVSEFHTMGEFAWRQNDGSTFRELKDGAGHWTVHTGVFVDYRRNRQQMRSDLGISR